MNASAAGTPQTATGRLEEHPRFVRFAMVLMDALKEYPEARRAVVRALEAAGET